jgi:ABC-type xylose transport system permease subunit
MSLSRVIMSLGMSLTCHKDVIDMSLGCPLGMVYDIAYVIDMTLIMSLICHWVVLSFCTSVIGM